MNSMQMACGYAREFPAQALLRLRPELRTKAVVVVEGEPPREFVCSANENSYALGVQRGMSRPQLEVFDHLEVLRRSPVEEHSARMALLECAGRFSPRVEELRFDYALGFAADITGTEKLLGPSQQIVAKLREQARALGIEISVAASCNLQAALCWTKAYPGAKVIPFGEEQSTLARIPIEVLDLTLEQSVTLSLWGIHTLGALAALPETALVARLGQEGQRPASWPAAPTLTCSSPSSSLSSSAKKSNSKPASSRSTPFSSSSRPCCNNSSSAPNPAPSRSPPLPSIANSTAARITSAPSVPFSRRSITKPC